MKTTASLWHSALAKKVSQEFKFVVVLIYIQTAQELLFNSLDFHCYR